MRDYDFTIPLENIAIYVNQSDAYYCQTQIALLASSSDNAIVLGSAFFTAFVGIFDTENERLGFAESINTHPGSSIKCNKQECTGSVQPLPHNPDHQGVDDTSHKATWILLAALLIVGAIIAGLVVFYIRKRQARRNSNSGVHGNSSRGRSKRRGYGLQDEREEDSDEENDLSQPM